MKQLLMAAAGLAVLAGPVAASADPQQDWRGNHQDRPAQDRPAQTPREAPAYRPESRPAPQMYRAPQQNFQYRAPQQSFQHFQPAPQYREPQFRGGNNAFGEPGARPTWRGQNEGRVQAPRAPIDRGGAYQYRYGGQNFGEPRNFNGQRNRSPQTFAPGNDNPRFAPRRDQSSGNPYLRYSRPSGPAFGDRLDRQGFGHERRGSLSGPAMRGVAANPAWRGLRGVNAGVPLVRQSNGRIQGPGAYQNLGWNHGGYHSRSDYYNHEREWWGRHSDWWENCEGFEDYDGPRFGFWFAPGWGYYQPSSYWYDYDWSVGVIVPYDLRGYYVSDPFEYGLPYAPYGTEWIFLGDQLVLIDLYSGEILEIAGGY